MRFNYKDLRTHHNFVCPQQNHQWNTKKKVEKLEVEKIKKKAKALVQEIKEPKKTWEKVTDAWVESKQQSQTVLKELAESLKTMNSQFTMIFQNMINNPHVGSPQYPPYYPPSYPPPPLYSPSSYPSPYPYPPYYPFPMSAPSAPQGTTVTITATTTSNDDKEDSEKAILLIEQKFKEIINKNDEENNKLKQELLKQKEQFKDRINFIGDPNKSLFINNGRCQAYTKQGSQCKRNSQVNRNYCWQHPR